MVNVPPTHFDAFLNATVKVFHDSSTFVLWDICTASTIAAFISYKFWRSLSQSLSFKNPNKWKSSCLKSGLFALHVWRVLRLMHLVSKWFEIHCSTSLDTWGAAPSCWNSRVVVRWPLSLVEAVSRSEIISSNISHYCGRCSVLIFEEELPNQPSGTHCDPNCDFLDETAQFTRCYYIYHNIYIFWDIMLKLLHNFSSWCVYRPVIFFSFYQKL